MFSRKGSNPVNGQLLSGAQLLSLPLDWHCVAEKASRLPKEEERTSLLYNPLHPEEVIQI